MPHISSPTSSIISTTLSQPTAVECELDFPFDKLSRKHNFRVNNSREESLRIGLESLFIGRRMCNVVINVARELEKLFSFAFTHSHSPTPCSTFKKKVERMPYANVSSSQRRARKQAIEEKSLKGEKMCDASRGGRAEYFCYKTRKAASGASSDFLIKMIAHFSVHSNFHSSCALSMHVYRVRRYVLG